MTAKLGAFDRRCGIGKSDRAPGLASLTQSQRERAVPDVASAKRVYRINVKRRNVFDALSANEPNAVFAIRHAYPGIKFRGRAQQR